MMNQGNRPLYQQIVEWVRQEINEGLLTPGGKLPSIRQMTVRWNCTPGTVQRAYVELARQGLVISHPGKGTHVVEGSTIPEQITLRKALLLHRAEEFLLETITAGYRPAEIETAWRMALDRWRVIRQEVPTVEQGILRFCGSHDPAITWLAVHFPEIFPHYTLQLSFTGSLGGLMALSERKADLAGSHLWDAETGLYNEPFVRRLFPGTRVLLVTFAQRRLGLIVQPGNPRNIGDLADLTRRDLRFINRQQGSGSRVWLDAELHKMGINPLLINGYSNEKMTHTEIAATIAEGNADVGIGLEAAAIAMNLSFINLVLEQYDLVIPAEMLLQLPVQKLVDWLATPKARNAIQDIGGYQTTETGQLRWVEEFSE